MHCGRRRAFAVALLAMNCACCEHFVRRCIAPFPHPAPARHCAPLQAQVPNPIAASWRPPPPGQHGGARFGQALLSGQRLHHAQASRRAARALLRVHTRHPLEELGCARQGFGAGRSHLQSRARARQSVALASAGQHPVEDSRIQDSGSGLNTVRLRRFSPSSALR